MFPVNLVVLGHCFNVQQFDDLHQHKVLFLLMAFLAMLSPWWNQFQKASFIIRFLWCHLTESCCKITYDIPNCFPHFVSRCADDDLFVSNISAINRNL
jgi:hypothetical protein